MNNPMLEAALSYERRSWSVLALCPKSKIPLGSWKRLQTARADAAEISRWWVKTADANVGVVTGTVSNLTVLDLDPRNDPTGETGQWLESMLPEPTVLTGSGGKHWYCLGSGPTIHAIRPGLDIQSNGAYVLAPPSIHPCKAPYVQLSADVPAAIPELLAAWIEEESARRQHEGQRRKSNNRGQTQTSGDGLTLDEALAVLQGAKKTKEGWLARCPAHDDHSPSLSVGEGQDGRLLARCWAGCSFSGVMAAIRDRHARQLVIYAQSLRLS